MQPAPDTLEITAHCLLRLVTALLIEAEGQQHGRRAATAELNQRTGRDLDARQWLAVLEPEYRRRFMPGDETPLC